MPHDVITFGEAMVRLAPPNFRRLEQTSTLDVQVGGAELNTAVGLARLGRSSAWVSRLTDNPLGRLVANRARAAGACCLGVGSQLVDPKLVAARAFDQLRDLAAKYVEVVRRTRAGQQ